MKNKVAIEILVIILVIILPYAVYGGSCGKPFPQEKCTCGRASFDNKIQYIVNCTNAGFRNTNALEFMPEQTEVLIFTGNIIPELPWNVFGTINNYSFLNVVDMTGNHIREIRGKSYHHVQNVRRLILNHNNLSISRDEDEVNHHHRRVFSNFLNLESLHLTNAFSDDSSPSLSEDLHDIFMNSNLTKLQKLHLEQNEISHFSDPKVFCDLPSLRDLHLGDNNLKEINFDVRCLKHLRFLDLESNHFEYLKKKDLALLDELQGMSTAERTTSLVVDFARNPFVCNCKINPFHLWLDKTNVTVRNVNNLLCYRNKIHPETILSVKDEKCEDENTSNGHTVTLMFLLVILSFILIGLLVALIYISREKLKHLVSPVLDNGSKKVQYTTIKDEECPEVHV